MGSRHDLVQRSRMLRQPQLSCAEAVLDTFGGEKEAGRDGIYYSASISEKERALIVKIVNAKEQKQDIRLELPEEWRKGQRVQATILTGEKKDACNSIGEPEKVAPFEREYENPEAVSLPPLSFAVLRMEL